MANVTTLLSIPALALLVQPEMLDQPVQLDHRAFEVVQLLPALVVVQLVPALVVVQLVQEVAHLVQEVALPVLEAAHLELEAVPE